jgi:signal peptidase I
MEEKKENKEINKKNIKVFIFNVIFIVLVVSIIRVFFAQAFNIPSGSMKPTLLIGDFILVNKFVYGDWTFGIPFTNITFYTYRNRLTTPDRGDIIVFKYPENPDIDFIKRVIGLPGDIVEVKNDIVYLNGKPLKREFAGKFNDNGSYVNTYYEYIPRKDGKIYKYRVMEILDGEGKNFGPIKVPENSYFVLGDNRDNSKDSRFWGFVPDSYLVGQAFVIYFSVKKGSLNFIRWNRIGKVLFNPPMKPNHQK